MDTHDQTALSGSFENVLEGAKSAYAHPGADELLIESFKILRKIETGARLLDVKDDYDIAINVVQGREITFSTESNKLITLFAPKLYMKQMEIIALTIACAIRDVEQGIVGFQRPSKESDPVEFAAMTFSKSLDVIVYMCKIADELKEKLGFQKPLDLIARLGHSEIYKAYKAEVDHDQLVDLFIKSEYKSLGEKEKKSN